MSKQGYRSAETGDIFGTDDGQIAKVKRVGRTGAVTVQIVGGPLDGDLRRLAGIPASWSRYPR